MKRQLIITITVAIVLALAAAGGTWYVIAKKFQDQKKESDKKIQELEKKIADFEGQKAESEDENPPDDFEKITVNETDIYYPSVWGSAKKEESKEEFGMQDNPFPTFAGETAVFGDYVTTFDVIDMESYEKYNDLKTNTQLIKKIYDEQKVDETEILAAPAQGYMPVVNAAVSAHNPKYVENKDGSWRGFWYLANITQGFSAKVRFVAIMYNKDKDKVTTIHSIIKSDESDQLTQKLDSANSDDLQAIGEEVDNYIATAYEKDEQVRHTIDSVLLKVCKFVN